MARIDERTEQFLREFTRWVVESYGEDLESVILYGSAAGLHFQPALSDLNVIVVLREITANRLKETSERLKRYHRERLEPLFLTSSQITALAEFYPIEMLEMKEQHRVLQGKDVLADVRVSEEGLRLQLLSELVGKSLRLRSLYLQCARDARRLEKVCSDIINPYRVLMRTLLRFSEKGFPPPSEYLEIVTQLEERHGFMLSGFREAYQIKLGLRRPLPEELHPLFETLMQEADLLAHRARGILRASS